MTPNPGDKGTVLLSPNNNKTYHGVTVSAGYGVYPTIAEVHGEVGQTWVAGYNIYDIMISLVYMLKE